MINLFQILIWFIRPYDMSVSVPNLKSFAPMKTDLWAKEFGEFSVIFLLTGLRIYTCEYKAQCPTLCPTEGRALRGLRALYSPV